MLLSIDTTTLVSTVAISTPDKLLAEITVQVKKTHSERLLPHIQELLALADVTKDNITGLAVSIGPGSFTGLRIGLATAKALAYTWKIPLVGVPTLEALAYGCPAPGVVLSPLIDAQKGNVYQALYRFEKGNLVEIMSPRVIHHEVALTELAQQDAPVLVMGEGAVMYADKIAATGGKVELAPPHVVIPRAGSVAGLGRHMLEKGIHHDIMTLEPYYIRRSEAEELWEKRQNACS